MRPRRFITLTRAGTDPAGIPAKMSRLLYLLRAEFGPMEWVFNVEANPKGTGLHVHAWQRGKRMIPQARLSELAVRCGFGPVADIRRWHGNADSSQYGFKGAIYGMKSAQENLDQFLTLNNRRLTHQSAGWWRGGVKRCERHAVSIARGWDYWRARKRWSEAGHGRLVRDLLIVHPGRMFDVLSDQAGTKYVQPLLRL